jgi:ubiquinone biosynthesis protein UbiJ
MTRLPLPVAQMALSGLNHVLQQQPAARDEMRAQAGRPIRIVVAGPLGPVHSDARIDADGFLSLSNHATPSAILTLSPSFDALFGVLGAGAGGLGPHIKVEGDVMLAALLGRVAQSLSWDFEEDLSRFVGDGLAHRIGETVRGLRDQADGLRLRSREAMQRAATSQRGPLVSAPELAVLAAEIARLSAEVSRLEARGARMARERTAGTAGREGTVGAGHLGRPT